MLDADTALAGTTINALIGQAKVHLQSALYAMDHRALVPFLNLTGWCATLGQSSDFLTTRTHAIRGVEHMFTHSVIDLGYNIATTQTTWLGLDFRNAAATQRRSPFWETDQQWPANSLHQLDSRRPRPPPPRILGHILLPIPPAPPTQSFRSFTFLGQSLRNSKASTEPGLINDCVSCDLSKLGPLLDPLSVF